MKNQILKTATSVLAILLLKFQSFAQDGELLDIDIDVNKDEWYEDPYLWLGVAAVIVLAILATRYRKK